jgi:hypothetical protein
MYKFSVTLTVAVTARDTRRYVFSVGTDTTVLYNERIEMPPKQIDCNKRSNPDTGTFANSKDTMIDCWKATSVKSLKDKNMFEGYK